MRSYTLTLGDLTIAVEHKAIRNLHLRIKPEGIQASAPLRVSQEEVRRFVLSKEAWIRSNVEKVTARGQRLKPEFVEGEIHHVAGRPYKLRLVEDSARGRVVLAEETGELIVHLGRDWEPKRKEALLARWYRRELEAMLPPVVALWEERIGVKAELWSIRAMRSRWGSCHLRTRKLVFSVELARVPPAGLELVVVHELVHLLEASHNLRFKKLMGHYLPDWKERAKALAAFSKGEMDEEI